MLTKIVLRAVRFYQNFISPHLGKICRFYPSCSEYCEQAVEKYGLVKGLWLGMKRVLRCNPFWAGGIDLP